MFCVIGNSCLAQPGCTDPRANNFDPSATNNDGSCTYDSTTHAVEFIHELSAPTYNEASGIVDYNGFWILNDGGNGPYLLESDSLSTGFNMRIKLLGARNIDWEALAQNPTHLLIGDIGNNNGNRTDLKIYHLKKSDLDTAFNGDSFWVAQTRFAYPDQTNFTSKPNNNAFDCEAMLWHNDTIYLFSKNWTNYYTKLYSIPDDTGTQVCILLDSFYSDALITGADMSQDGRIALIAYDLRPTIPHVLHWSLWDYPGSQFFAGNKRKVHIENSVLATAQAEGICFTAPYNNYICGERITVGSATIFARLNKLNTRAWTEYWATGLGKIFDESPFRLMRDGADLFVDGPSIPTQIDLFNALGQKVWTAKTSNLPISIPKFVGAMFFIQIENEQSRGAFTIFHW